MADDALFAAYFVQNDCDAVEALKKCGFVGAREDLLRHAQKVMSRDDVKQQLREIRQALTMDAEETLQRLADIARGVRPATSKTFTSAKGAVSTTETYSPLEALKIVMKHQGLLDPVFGNKKLPKNLTDLRMALAERLKQPAAYDS